MVRDVLAVPAGRDEPGREDEREMSAALPAKGVDLTDSALID